MTLAGATLQIFLAIVVVIIFGVIGFLIFNWEQVKAVQTSVVQRKTVPIFVGIKDLKACGDESYNTTTKDPLDANFRDMSDAVNQPGGAEMTYNFWLYVDGAKAKLPPVAGTSFKTDAGIKSDQVVLFLRGSPKTWTYKNMCQANSSQVNSGNKTDVLVKCPLVKLEKGGDALSVEFNTVLSPDVLIANSTNTCDSASSDWNYTNGYKLGVTGFQSAASLKQKWNMVTIVIQDTNPADPLPIRNKVRCRIFVNGGVELDKYVDGSFASLNNAKPSVTTLKPNSGDFWVAPKVISAFYAREGKIEDKSLMMADLTYYNYALNTTEISNAYNANFTKSYAPGYGTTKTISNDTSWMNNVSMNTHNYKMSGIAKR